MYFNISIINVNIFFIKKEITALTKDNGYLFLTH